MLLFVLLAGTIAVATGVAVDASESRPRSGATLSALGRDDAAGFVPASISRAPDGTPRDLDSRRDVAVWLAFSCGLAAIGVWLLARDPIVTRAVAGDGSTRRTRAPPVMPPAVVC